MGLKAVVCFQARTGSSRFPGKILKRIGDKSVLEYIVHRLSYCKEIDDIVFTTSTAESDRALVEIAKGLGIKYHTGPEEDILTRLIGAGHEANADAVVRVLGDCPFVDPKLVDKAVALYRKMHNETDMVNNFYPPTFPDGLDIDVTSIKAMEKLDSMLPEGDFYRAWWLSYMFEHPTDFKVHCFKHPKHLAHIRLTMDHPDDLALICEIHKRFSDAGKDMFYLDDIMELLERDPALCDINRHHIDTNVVDGVRSAAYHSLKPKKTK